MYLSVAIGVLYGMARHDLSPELVIAGQYVILSWVIARLASSAAHQ